MEIYKIIVVALIAAILCLYLKNVNSEFFVLVLIGSGILILLMSLNYFTSVFSIFNDLISRVTIDEDLFVLIIKITLVAYLIEFACNTIEDFGIKSLSDKVAFGGKLILFCMSSPIFINLIEVVVGFLS